MRKKRSTVFGAAIILFAVILRLGGVSTAPVYALRHRNAAAHYIFRHGPGGILTEKIPPTAPSIPATTPPDPGKLFTAADTEGMSLRYTSGCHYRPDLPSLITAPLDWDLDNGEPAVLILHTHGTEAYTKTAGQDYREHIRYRTRNTDYNVVAVGDLLKQSLEAAGIRVIHDRTLYDDISYNDAYSLARKSVKNYLQQYPSIQLVLDLHRDAATNADGSTFATGVTVAGETIAQLMLVMGTDAAGLDHPDWEGNLAVALKLLALLEQTAPNITRTTSLRANRYNQDLHPAMLLVEVGSSGNTLSQAKAAIAFLADAIIALKNGANRPE